MTGLGQQTTARPKNRLHRIEVTVVVQQPVSVVYTEHFDENIDRFAHSKAPSTHRAIIPRCLDRDIVADHRCHHVLPQVPFDPNGVCLIPSPLQDIGHHQIANDQRFLPGQCQ
ncbi:MAG TPA: hypothetical protein VGM42_09670, partial [Rhodopila sp.]